jgi:hypothetical protein
VTFDFPQSADLMIGYGGDEAALLTPLHGARFGIIEGTPLEQVTRDDADGLVWHETGDFPVFATDTVILHTAGDRIYALGITLVLLPDQEIPVLNVRYRALDESSETSVSLALPFYNALDLENGAIFSDPTVASVLFCDDFDTPPPPPPA